MPDGLVAREVNHIIHEECCYTMGRKFVERIKPRGADAGAWRRLRHGCIWNASEPEFRVGELEDFVESADRDRRVGQRRRLRREAYRFLLNAWPEPLRLP